MLHSLLTSRKTIMTAIFSLGALAAQAQDAAPAVEKTFAIDADAWVTGVVLVAALVIVASFFITMRVIRIMADELRISRLKAAGKWTEADEALLVEAARAVEEKRTSKVKRKTVITALTDAVPIERESEVMLDHDYDGIRELDNNLPPWWTALFYVTTIFGIIYLVWFHVLGIGLSSSERYEKEMARADEQRQALLASQTDRITENTVTLLTDAGEIESGEAIFVKSCVACHSASAGGLAGVAPNLTDEYWIHGGGIKEIFTTIKYGVPTKGMISWKDQLKPGQIQEVASYILSLQGSNPEDGIEPQGEIWNSEVEAPAEPADTTTNEQAMDEATATALNVRSLHDERETE